MDLCGQQMERCGVLVVKDPPGGVSAQVSGVLGMKVIRRCYSQLFGQHGLALYDTPSVSAASECMMEALQKCHQANVQAPPRPQRAAGKVKVRGRGTCRIPGGTMALVTVTCSEQYSGTTTLFEPRDSGLPAGLLASPALVRVERGTAYVPIVNVGATDVLLYPRTEVGSLEDVHVVSLPSGVMEVPLVAATVASQSAAGSVQDHIETMDLSVLSAEDQTKVRSLLMKHASVFSAHDRDLGSINLIAHDTPLLDEVPVRQRYRRIPPSDYEVVKEHINKLLEAQIIRESSSPYASHRLCLSERRMAVSTCVSITGG